MTWVENARTSFERFQIPIYFAAVALGFAAALIIPGAGRLDVLINPSLALMLFATFLQVPLVKLRSAFSNRRFLGALLVANFLVIPLLVATMLPFLPANPLVRVAVLFVLLTPCIDYVVTFAHLGKADSSLLLAATPILLAVQLLLLPAYLAVLLGTESAELVQAGPFVYAFIWLIAVPLLLAAGLQAAIPRSPAAIRIARWGSTLPVPATAWVLFIVVAAVTPRLGAAIGAAISALPFFIAFAIIAPVLGLIVSRTFRLAVPARRAVMFSSGTRNSLVILPLAMAIPDALPVVPAVIVSQTLVELVAMLVYVPLIHRVVTR